MRIKNNSILLFSAFATTAMLFGCGSVNKLKKTETVKSDSTYVVTTVSTNTLTLDLDSTLKVKPDSAHQEVPLANLIAGDTTDTKTPTVEVKTYYDKAKKKVVTDIKTTPAPIDIHIHTKSVTSNTTTNTGEVKKQIKTEDKEKHKEGVSMFKLGMGLAIPISLLILLIILYLIFRKRIKLFLPWMP